MALAAVTEVHGAELKMQPTEQESLNDTMKEIRKAKLHRRVLSDPSLAQKLVAVEASPVYNSKGELIPSLGFNG